MERSVVLKILKGTAPGGETLFSYEVIIGTETFTTHDVAHAQKMASEHARPGVYKVEGQGGAEETGQEEGVTFLPPRQFSPGFTNTGIPCILFPMSIRLYGRTWNRG